MEVRVRPGDVQFWTTDSVPPKQRREYFAAMAADTVLPLRHEFADANSVSASIELASIKGIFFTCHQGSAHVSYSGRAEIARQREHRFNLVTSIGGPWEVEQRGETRIGGGESFFSDSRLPVTLHVPDAYNLVNIGMPEQWVRRWIPAPDGLVGKIRGSWSGALSRFAACLTPQRVANLPFPQHLLLDQLGGLLTLMSRAHDDERDKPVPRDNRLLAKITEVIRMRCGESALSANDVAASVDISLRSLHRALAKDGAPFGSLLLRERVALATRMLESPSFDRVTIAEVGRRAGFSDGSHFVRVMRRYAGATPTELRKRRSS